MHEILVYWLKQLSIKHDHGNRSSFIVQPCVQLNCIINSIVGLGLCSIQIRAGFRRGPGPQASHHRRASHQTAHILSLANELADDFFYRYFIAIWVLLCTEIAVQDFAPPPNITSVGTSGGGVKFFYAGYRSPYFTSPHKLLYNSTTASDPSSGLERVSPPITHPSRRLRRLDPRRLSCLELAPPHLSDQSYTPGWAPGLAPAKSGPDTNYTLTDNKFNANKSNMGLSLREIIIRPTYVCNLNRKAADSISAHHTLRINIQKYTFNTRINAFSLNIKIKNLCQ